MRRPLALLIALVAVALLPSAASAAVKVGISDQQAITFSNPLFPQIKSKIARYIAPYDVMSDPVQLQRLEAWIAGAQAQRQTILIHFEHSRKSLAEGNKAPSVAVYTAAIKAFKAKFSSKKLDIGVWNEVNRKRDRTRGAGQPVATKYALLASYYKAAKKVFKGQRIVALDVLDENKPKSAIKHVERFQRAVGKAETRKLILGLHNYSDTNRFGVKRTGAVLKAFKGKEVWLTETGGIVKLGTTFAYDEARAARALGCMFTLAKKFKKVKRLYVYQWNPATNPADIFDAGLIGVDGQPRAGLAVVKSRKAGKCSAR